MSRPHDELDRVVRDHAGQLAGSLMHLLGDFAAAEDLVQDAIETALQRWPVEGIPARPDAWLLTVARRRAIDVLRRQTSYREAPSQVAAWVIVLHLARSRFCGPSGPIPTWATCR